MSADDASARRRRIYATIRDIPEGAVASYGRIAGLAGVPRGARQVGHALRELPDGHDVPWHRVLRASGRIAFAAGSSGRRRQVERLRAEGVEVRRGRVDMRRFGWQPDLDELLWKPSAAWDVRYNERRAAWPAAEDEQRGTEGTATMAMPAVYFSHGQESGPWGTKITSMAAVVRELGCAAESVDYRGIADPGDRVATLERAVKDVREPLLLVGSSMGGYVATAAAARREVAGLFVLAPAYHMPGFETLPPLPDGLPIAIVHGWHDDVVPVDNSIRFARSVSATLHVVDGDHRLTGNLDEINDYLRRFLGRIVPTG